MVGLQVLLGGSVFNWGWVGAAGSWGARSLVLGLALVLVLSLCGLPSGAVVAFVGLNPMPGAWGYVVGDDAVIAPWEFAPTLVPV